jgi:hypothetical protein
MALESENSKDLVVDRIASDFDEYKVDVSTISHAPTWCLCLLLSFNIHILVDSSKKGTGTHHAL